MFPSHDPRLGFSDSKYRLRLYGQIAINTSKGTPENLISIFNILTGSTSSFYQAFPIAETSIFGNVPPVSGTELLVDGDMEAAGVSDWTVVNSATLTKENTDPYEGTQNLRVAYNAVNEPGASQSVLTSGTWYLVNWSSTNGEHFGTSPCDKKWCNYNLFGFCL